MNSPKPSPAPHQPEKRGSSARQPVPDPLKQHNPSPAHSSSSSRRGVPPELAKKREATVRREKKKAKTGLMIGLGLGGFGLVAAIIAAVVATSGGPPPPAKQDPVVRKDPPPPVYEPPPRVNPGTRLPEPPPKTDTEGPPPPIDPLAEFKKRFAFKQGEAKQRLTEARQELAAQQRAEADAAQALVKRLSGRPVDIVLRSGNKYPKSVIKTSNITDVEFESGGKTLSLPWDAMTAETLLAAVDALYDSSVGERLFERGRFLIARRLWKEAKDALTKAVKLDEGLASRTEEVMPILEKMITGQAAYRGAARRVGPAGLVLTYDWKDDGQLQEFSSGLAFEKGALVMESKERRLWGLRVDFADEVEVEAKVTSDAPFSLYLYAGDAAFEAVFEPEGLEIHALEPRSEKWKRSKSVVKNAAAKLTKGQAMDLRFALKARRLKVTLGRAEVASVEVPAAQDEPTCWIGFGVTGGKAAIAAPFTVRGTCDARELDKKFAEVEILVRRCVDPELKDIEELRERDRAREVLGTREGITLSADDAYFTIERMGADLVKYDDMKRQLAEYLSTGIGRKTAEKAINEMIDRCKDVPSLHYLRALLAFMSDLDDISEAREDLKKALELFPEFVEALVLQARIVDLMDGDFDESLKLATKAIEVMPDYAPAYLQRAKMRFALSRRNAPAAMEDLRVVLALSSMNREAPTLLRAFRWVARGPRDLGCRFEVESDHYIVMTDISQDAAKLYSDRLEAAYRFYKEQYKGVYQEKPFEKPRVAVFFTAENYYTYGELIDEDRGENSVGVFRKRFNELVMFDDLDEDETLDTLHHEQFHHFMSLMVPHYIPYWFNEGIAEYMGALRVKDGKVVESARIQKRRMASFQPLMKAGMTFGWGEMMLESPGEFYGFLAPYKYAQSWSMIHFFNHHENGKYKALIDRYFEMLRTRKTPKEAFEAVFKDKEKELTKEWKKYATALPTK